jgi:hypothetical protein
MHACSVLVQQLEYPMGLFAKFQIGVWDSAQAEMVRSVSDRSALYAPVAVNPALVGRFCAIKRAKLGRWYWR